MRLAFNPYTGGLDVSLSPVRQPFSFAAECDPDTDVGYLVRVVSSASGGIHVTRADISAPSGMPCVGIVVAKPSSTRCMVAYYGVVRVASGLVPGARYFVAADSRPSSTVPTGPCMLQVIGIALDHEQLFVAPSLDMTRIR